uniref:ERAP1-like C-terminal domain-containing protein n=1 Tax=Ditylenchus dipsaci TaxID=166011 RepID=A0A915ESK4_9BILA
MAIFQTYIKRFQYSNVDYNDFLNVLSENTASLNDNNGNEKSIFEFAKTWLVQPGYPVVFVERLDNNTCQEEYGQFLFAATLKVDTDNLLLINENSYGFYKVKYAESLMMQFSKILIKNDTNILPRSLAKIIDDTFSMAEAGLNSYKLALDFYDILTPKSDPSVVLSFISQLNHLTDEYMENESKEADLIQVKELYHLLTQEMLDLPDDTKVSQDLDMFHKQFLEPCFAHGGTLILNSTCSWVPLELRKRVYCNGVKYGNETEFNFISDLFITKKIDFVEKKPLLEALCCSQHEHNLKALLSNAVSKHKMFSMLDIKLIFNQMPLNKPYGAKFLFNFFMEHWQSISKRFYLSPDILDTIIDSSFKISSEETVAKIEKLITHKSQPFIVERLKKQLSLLKMKLLWKKNHNDEILNWFTIQATKKTI